MAVESEATFPVDVRWLYIVGIIVIFCVGWEVKEKSTYLYYAYTIA